MVRRDGVRRRFRLALAGFLGGCFEDHFGFFRLWAYGLFLHGVVLLVATTVLWRRSRPWLAGGVLWPPWRCCWWLPTPS